MFQVGWAVGHWSPHPQGSWAWPEGNGVRLDYLRLQAAHISFLHGPWGGRKAGKHRPGLLNLCLSQKPAGGLGWVPCWNHLPVVFRGLQPCTFTSGRLNGVPCSFPKVPSYPMAICGWPMEAAGRKRICLFCEWGWVLGLFSISVFHCVLLKNVLDKWMTQYELRKKTPVVFLWQSSRI